MRRRKKEKKKEMAKFELKADSVEELSKGINPAKAEVVEPENEVSSKEQEVKLKDTSNEETKVNLEAPKRKPGRPRKIDQMSAKDAITLHTQRNTHAVQKADIASKKEIYSSEHVFVEDGDEAVVETDSTARREEWLELVASAQENNVIDVLKGTRILKGTITSITEVPTTLDKDDPDYIPDFMARVRFKTGQFDVKIPSSVLYYYHYENYNRAMAEDVQKNMMRRLGAEIDFVCRFADEKTGVVYGDRLAALSMRGVRNYTSINGRRPKVVPGELVQAKIVAISREYITVDAAGAEIRIPLEEISWLYMSDAREFDGIKTAECFKVGGRVNVKILTAEVQKVRVGNSNYTLIKATGSIKQAKANPRLKYFDEFASGDLYAGYITGVTESGVYVNLDNKMDCLCKFPSYGKMPIMGEQRIVRITMKDEEKKFIYGVLI